MKRKMVYGVALGLLLCGCISAERQAEFSAWRASEDGVATATLEEFETRYKNGWRERASEKTKVRLAREAKEREEAARRSEYEEWLKSDDGNAAVDMAGFEKSHRNGWRDRAEQKKKVRLAKEAKERAEREAREAKEREIARQKAEQEALKRRRYAFVEMLATNELAKIRETYSKGKKYGNPYRYDVESPSEKIREDWLGTWTAPRLSLTKDGWRILEKIQIAKKDRSKRDDWELPVAFRFDSVYTGSGKLPAVFRLSLTEEDRLAGEALLSEFGTKYLPLAFANYKKIKNFASELQQVFNENFPEPWVITKANSKWSSFNKNREKFTRVRTDYFVFHDELCHYWLAWRLGVLSADDLAKLDAKYLGVRLLPENVEWAGQTRLAFCEIEAKLAEFAVKYAPESYAAYQKLEREYNEVDKLLKDVVKQIGQLDYVRFDRTLAAAVDKRKDIARESIMLLRAFEAWNVDLRTMEKSAEDVAKLDRNMALSLKPFVASLPNYIRERALGPIIARSEMVSIPNGVIVKKERVQKQRGHFNRKGKWVKELVFDWVDEIVTNKIENLKVQRTEVTQIQWMSVMGNNPSLKSSKGTDFPVQKVSWNDCQEFIKRLNAMNGTHYRLPTEREWEYACLAGGTGVWGKRRNGEEGPLEAMGWSAKDVKEGTRKRSFPVALKLPNAWGLFDMHGNVEELCDDGKADSDGKTRKICFRGGTCVVKPDDWQSRKNYEEECSATAARGWDSLNSSVESVGFRLVTSQD